MSVHPQDEKIHEVDSDFFRRKKISEALRTENRPKVFRSIAKRFEQKLNKVLVFCDFMFTLEKRKQKVVLFIGADFKGF